MNNKVETLINIFTVDQGDVKLLLLRKKTEPYKGYWILPGNNLSKEETVEDNITDSVYNQTGLLSLYIEQCHTFSKIDRIPDERMLAISFIGLIDSVTAKIKVEDRDTELEWFPITNLPKMGYDHDSITEYVLKYLGKKIVNANVLKTLYPSDFTLPELQKSFEQILGKTFDRRNFRKKFINLDLIEDTNEFNEGGNGRPAKLYRFKENLREKDLF